MTYRGSCHCGRVRYECEGDLAAGTYRCNCTYCAKTRSWTMLVQPAGLRILGGQEDLGSYQFGAGRVRHRFCRHCGVRTFSEGESADAGPFRTVAVATLEVSPEELARATVRYTDGLHDRWQEAPLLTSYL